MVVLPRGQMHSQHNYSGEELAVSLKCFHILLQSSTAALCGLRVQMGDYLQQLVSTSAK